MPDVENLTLAVVRVSDLRDWCWWSGYHRLCLDPEPELHQSLHQTAIALPDFVYYVHFTPEGLRESRTDASGRAVTYTTPGRLTEFRSANEWNTAILRMLKAMSAETPIVLWFGDTKFG